MILGRPRPGERCKDDTMREGQSTNSERSEESRRLGGRRHLSLELSNSRRVRVFRVGLKVKFESEAGLLESDLSTSHLLYPRGFNGMRLAYMGD